MNQKARILIQGRIRLKSGLRIGAQREGAEIGGIDNPIIKHPATGEPYIPGSSIKGKLRSLFEVYKNSKDPEKYEFNRSMKEGLVKIHACDKDFSEIPECEVCRLFGTSGQTKDNFPSRLIFRDAMPVGWRDELLEVKYEAAIDRITSAANPRPMERVAPGAEFKFEVVYRMEDNNYREDLKNLVISMRLLEDDYLGGAGSRGYGKVEILIDRIVKRSMDYYTGKEDEHVLHDTKGSRVEEIERVLDSL